MYDKNKAAQDNDIEEKRLSYTTQNIRNLTFACQEDIRR